MSARISVSLQNVTTKRRGKTILGPISFEFPQDGVTIVLGPNGSGKTTLLKVTHGIERISAGDVRWSVSKSAARSAQSYVFQTPVMLRRSVRQNLAYPLQLIGTDKGEIAGRVADWSKRVGLDGMLDRAATRLSGGERQKLALGRALIREPKVLFLDEPCANLDGQSTREIEGVLEDMRAAGTQIIMATHDMGQARRLANHVVFLLNGKLHEQGDAASFFASPKTLEAAQFLRGDIVV